jgi:hypothetical protein
LSETLLTGQMAVAGLFGFPNEFAGVLQKDRAGQTPQPLRRDIRHSVLSLNEVSSDRYSPQLNRATPITNGKKARNGIEPDPHHGGASLSSVRRTEAKSAMLQRTAEIVRSPACKTSPAAERALLF